MDISRTIHIPKVVYIVDDDVDDQLLLEEALLEVNPAVICYKSNNGEEGILALQNPRIPRPDLIFADLNMPRLNGRQFLKQIVNDPNLKTIPVIIYSTAYYAVEVNEILAMGAAAFLQKPNDFNQLVKVLRKELFSLMVHDIL